MTAPLIPTPAPGSLVFGYIEPSAENHQQHTWTAVGEHGAIHVWAVPSGDYGASPYRERFYGGIEVHSLTGEGEPSHSACWLLNAPCWHDGSSLFFSENIEPMLRHMDAVTPSISETINRIMAQWYETHLVPKVPA